MRYPELAGNQKFDFLLPIGSTEQHGPFAPFGADTYITDYLVNQIEKQFPKLVILPTLEFSRSGEHRGFFGTIFLSEDTLGNVLFDICNSIVKKAGKIFIISFHSNDEVIRRFIKGKATFFKPAEIVNLKMYATEDEKKIEKLIGGPLDDHAGNTEISSMLVIDESTIVPPTNKDKKFIVDDPFGTDNIAEKSSTGIADNHPEWIIKKEVGQRILDLYVARLIQNLKK